MSGFGPACSSPACARLQFYPAFVTMLVQEDGSIVSVADGDANDANTFSLEADVDAYAALYGFSFTGTTTAKEQAILRAMIYIESFEDSLRGSRVSVNQVLSWPRNYVSNKLNTGYLSATAIPPGVTNALNEAAILELATPGVLTASISGAAMNVKRQRRKVGPLETETEYSAGADTTVTQYRRILEFLRPYLNVGGASYTIRGH